MTSPSDDDTQALPPAPPPAPANPAPESASGGPAAAIHSPAPAGPPPPYAYFQPVVRTPWINPAKRGAVALVAMAAAFVIGGGGLITGLAIGTHHARVTGVQLRGGPFGPGMGPGQRGAFPQRRGYLPRPTVTTTVTATPSPTKTS